MFARNQNMDRKIQTGNTKQSKTVKASVEKWLALNWKSQIEVVIQLLSIEPSGLTQKDLDITKQRFSLFAQFSTLIDMVTSQDGLGISWSEWLVRVDAFQISLKYHQACKTPEQMIENFDLISSYLGRSPVDAIEFHKVRAIVIQRFYQKKLSLKDEQIISIVDKNKSLIKEIEKRDHQIALLQAELNVAILNNATLTENLLELQKQLLRIEKMVPVELKTALINLKKWRNASIANQMAFDKLDVYTKELMLKLNCLRSKQESLSKELRVAELKIRKYKVKRALSVVPFLVVGVAFLPFALIGFLSVLSAFK